MPNVLSPRDLVFRPDNIDKTVLYTHDEARTCIPVLRLSVSTVIYSRHSIHMSLVVRKPAF